MYREWQVRVPKWVPWFAVALGGPVWLWSSYRALLSQAGQADFAVGVWGWLILTFAAVAAAGALFVMAYRGVPALLIHTGPSAKRLARRREAVTASTGERATLPEGQSTPPQFVSVELTARQREQIAAILGRDTDRLRIRVDRLDELAEDAFLSAGEHLHDLWVVLGLGEK